MVLDLERKDPRLELAALFIRQRLIAQRLRPG
jgi:hypothetical protein